MMRLHLLPIAVVFLFLGALAMASPPVAPPPEGFIIKSETNIQADGDVTESEKYHWTYFEGVGNLGAETLATRCQGDPVCLQRWYEFFSSILPVDPVTAEDIADRYIWKQGFQQGAEIAYQQDFRALDGTTTFIKNFLALSKTDTTHTDNLAVDKSISFTGHNPTSYATHEEKVGLSVVSQGGELTATSVTGGLLTLCPWGGTGNRATPTTNNGCGECGCLPGQGCGIPSGQGCDYPATNEGIAAGSSFKVTNLLGFTSKSRVNSVDNPALSYEVNAPSGTGRIAAGFVVELWEGAGCWGQRDLFSYMGCCGFDSGMMVQDHVPPVASRVHYAEHATADGTWAFTKKVNYQSVMPSSAPSGTFPFPFNQVP